MTTLKTMTDRITREVQRDGLTADIRDAIRSAIQWHRNDRFDFNVTSATAQLATGDVTLALPTGLMDMERLELSATGMSATEVKQRPWQEVQNAANAAGSAQARPSIFAIYNELIWFDSPVDKVYEATSYFLQDLPEISASATGGEANAWMTDGELVIRNRAKQFLYEDRLGNFRKSLQSEKAANKSFHKLKREMPTTDHVTPTRF